MQDTTGGIAMQGRRTHVRYLRSVSDDADERYGIVARKIGLPKAYCICVGNHLMDVAAAADESGSIAGFDIDVCAERYGLEVDEIRRIMAGMMMLNRPIHDGARVLAWAGRMPKPGQEDPRTVRERTRRHREKAAAADVETPLAPESEIVVGTPAAPPPAPAAPEIVEAEFTPVIETVEPEVVQAGATVEPPPSLAVRGPLQIGPVPSGTDPNIPWPPEYRTAEELKARNVPLWERQVYRAWRIGVIAAGDDPESPRSSIFPQQLQIAADWLMKFCNNESDMTHLCNGLLEKGAAVKSAGRVISGLGYYNNKLTGGPGFLDEHFAKRKNITDTTGGQDDRKGAGPTGQRRPRGLFQSAEAQQQVCRDFAARKKAELRARNAGAEDLRSGAGG